MNNQPRIEEHKHVTPSGPYAARIDEEARRRGLEAEWNRNIIQEGRRERQNGWIAVVWGCDGATFQDILKKARPVPAKRARH